MASRILHYVIATEIAGRLSIDDMDRFIIGSLLPDASQHEDDSYAIAHFGEKHGINCELFEGKYQEEILTDSLYLGYLCHLIADKIWFKRITDKFVRIHPKKDRIAYIQKGYEDFQKLNSLLIEEYALSCPTLEFAKLDTQEIEIQEIRQELVAQVSDAFQEDFNACKKYDNYEFAVYPYEAVRKFISEAVAVCVKEINALRNGGEKVDFSIYRKEPRS